MQFRILHVGHVSVSQKAVADGLGLDPGLCVASCANWQDALATVSRQPPDLILADMTDEDDLAAFARSRKLAGAANIPIVVMVAHVRSGDVDRLKAGGAAAVVSGPPDPANLAEVVREQLRSAKLAAAEGDFRRRLLADAANLKSFRKQLRSNAESDVTLESLQSCAHKLAGAAGVFSFPVVSVAASTLEETIIRTRAGQGRPGKIEADLDALLECLVCT